MISELSRLFLDSNVLTKGIIVPTTLDHAILKLCTTGVYQLVLAEVVKAEVENNLLSVFTRLGESADRLLSDYDEFLKHADPEVIQAPAIEEVQASRHLIRHQADVPVLVSDEVSPGLAHYEQPPAFYFGGRATNWPQNYEPSRILPGYPGGH